MKVIIIGAGLGGLACAIACRRYGLEVVVLEQTPKIIPVRSQEPAARTFVNVLRSALEFKRLPTPLAC